MLEILLIGSELLEDYYGALPAFYYEMFETFGELFAKHRIRLGRIGIVPDDTTAIISWLNEAKKGKSDLVMTIGGLGPTPDDITKEAICEYLGDELELKPEALESVNSFFERKIGYVPPIEGKRLKMAAVPRSSKVLPSIYGAAPGFYIAPSDGTVGIVALPGVTTEACAIFAEQVVQLLEPDYPEDWSQRIFRVKGVPEVELAPIFAAAEDAFDLQFGTYLEKDERGVFNIVRIVLKGPEERLKAAEEFIIASAEEWLNRKGNDR